MPLLTDPAPLLRLTAASYGDGISSIARIDDAAEIARILFDQEGDMPSGAGLSSLFVDWGQLVDHDIDLTRDASGEVLEVPGLVGPFQRSVFDPTSGTSPDNPRIQVNEITPEIDASQVYGSTQERTDALRAFEGGRLRILDGTTDADALMPLAQEGDVMAGAGATDSPIFLAGDVRANENLNLTVLQTLFVREHNSWADRLAALHGDWSDEQLFQTARAIVEYEMQAITWRDFLPKLLAGHEDSPAWLEPPSRFTTPDGGIDGQITVEFSTAAYRFGHTMVSSDVAVMEEEGIETPGVDLAIADVLFNPQPLLDGYFDHVLRGQAATMAQESDAKMIDDLNFFLRAPDGMVGFSLAALNILRGRDNGIAPYLEVRADLLGDVDLSTIAPGDFSVITSDPQVQADLAAVYDSVFDVDLWVGGLAEDRAAGAILGPLFAYIVIEQFERIRAGDEGFMTLPDTLDAALVSEIEAADLHDIILRNSGITHLQDDPFVTIERLHGSDTPNALSGTAGAEFLFGLDGGDLIFAEAGDDTVIGGAGADTVDGGAGQDTAAYSGTRDNYSVSLHADGTLSVSDRHIGGEGTDTLQNIEALSFADGDWALEKFDGVVTLSEADFRALVELYIATFDRAPDSEGLFFWGNAMADGMSLGEIAALFFDQDETRALYPDLSDPAGFVDDVYQNVLGRAADAEGAAFWTGVLERGEVSFGDFVLDFLDGTRAPAPPGIGVAFLLQQLSDQKYLEGKTDLGLHFAAIKGMNDVAYAHDMMALYDGTDTGMAMARSMMDSAYDDMVNSDGGGFQLTLVGVIDDPFAMM